MDERVKVAVRGALNDCLEIMSAMDAEGSPAQEPVGPGAPELELDDMEMFDEILSDWNWDDVVSHTDMFVEANANVQQSPDAMAGSGWSMATPLTGIDGYPLTLV